MTETAPRDDAGRSIDRNMTEHLLGRLANGKTLMAAEITILRALINAERSDAEAARAQCTEACHDAANWQAEAAALDAERIRVAERLTKARQQRDHHRGVAEGLRRSLAFAAEAPLNCDVWARLGMALGWTPERAGEESRKRRLHAERTLAQRVDQAREETEALRQQHDRHRRALAEALGLDADAQWPAITQQATTQHADWARCQDEAERSARANVAAAQQSEQQAGETLSLRHRQLADALDCERDTSWPDLIETARRVFEAGPVRRAAVVEAEQHHRRLAAILAKPAETPFADLTEYAAQTLTRGGERIIDAQQRAERAEARAEGRAEAAKQWKAHAVRRRKRAEQAEAALAAVRAELDRIAALPTVTIDDGHADRFSTGARWTIRMLRTALGDPQPATAEPDLGPCATCGARPVVYRKRDNTLICHDCVRCECGQTPCARTGTNDPAVSSEAAEPQRIEVHLDNRGATYHPWPDGAALWAAIRDHAARDTDWWRRIERARYRYAGRVRP